MQHHASLSRADEPAQAGSTNAQGHAEAHAGGAAPAHAASQSHMTRTVSVQSVGEASTVYNTASKFTVITETYATKFAELNASHAVIFAELAQAMQSMGESSTAENNARNLDEITKTYSTKRAELNASHALNLAKLAQAMRNVGESSTAYQKAQQAAAILEGNAARDAAITKFFDATFAALHAEYNSPSTNLAERIRLVQYLVALLKDDRAGLVEHAQVDAFWESASSCFALPTSLLTRLTAILRAILRMVVCVFVGAFAWCALLFVVWVFLQYYTCVYNIAQGTAAEVWDVVEVAMDVCVDVTRVCATALHSVLVASLEAFIPQVYQCITHHFK